MAASILPFDISPSYRLLAHEFSRALAYLLLPLALLYLSLYFGVKGHKRVYVALTFAALVAFTTATSVAPIQCPPAASLMNFGGAFAFPPFSAPKPRHAPPTKHSTS